MYYLTLWPFHVDDYQFPFTKDRLGIVRDACDCELALYSETKEVLENLRINNIKMAVASRITDVASAYQLLYLFELRKYFVCTEIYPTRKSLHFAQLKKKTNIDYHDMIFFDDDVRNLKCVEKLGVEVHQVVDGISANHVRFG
ncbi:magnesium-dependent phosphatase 1-like isoform X3 [Rhodnius prolixus]|uniref:magnesium-dependent phosphatase 1-like isoform X3 n=1 Tax=Rhodnius prolixus TaxID=13249 RepID=UPI003D1893F6